MLTRCMQPRKHPTRWPKGALPFKLRKCAFLRVGRVGRVGCRCRHCGADPDRRGTKNIQAYFLYSILCPF